MQKLPLSDAVYERAVGDIASGLFPVGRKLPSEAVLADRYDVSRPVLRDALARMRADGLIVSRQGYGSEVVRLPGTEVLSMAPTGTLADLMRAFEFRLALEGEAAALAADRRGERDLREMRLALKALDSHIQGVNWARNPTFAFTTQWPMRRQMLTSVPLYRASRARWPRELKLHAP